MGGFLLNEVNVTYVLRHCVTDVFSLDFQCAVKGVLFPAGANPARQLSLQPEALEAVQGGNELD
jgi:hypothetical protein